MKIIIVPNDKVMFVDGKPERYEPCNEMNFHPSVRAILYDTETERGEVQFIQVLHTIQVPNLAIGVDQFAYAYAKCMHHYSDLRARAFATDENERHRDEAEAAMDEAERENALRNEAEIASRMETARKAVADAETLKSAALVAHDPEKEAVEAGKAALAAAIAAHQAQEVENERKRTVAEKRRQDALSLAQSAQHK